MDLNLPTSRLSGGRSNQLSYRPAIGDREPGPERAGLKSVRPRSGLQKLNSVWIAEAEHIDRQSDSPIERVTGRTRDSSSAH